MRIEEKKDKSGETEIESTFRIFWDWKSGGHIQRFGEQGKRRFVNTNSNGSPCVDINKYTRWNPQFKYFFPATRNELNCSRCMFLSLSLQRNQINHCFFGESRCECCFCPCDNFNTTRCRRTALKNIHLRYPIWRRLRALNEMPFISKNVLQGENDWINNFCVAEQIQ